MKYIEITGPDINNGLGCRVTLWVSGCKHNCPGCQNRTTTWNFNLGNEFTEDSMNELLERIGKPYIKGLTLSGGDPAYSARDLIPVVRKVKEVYPEKDIWMYSGFTLDQLLKNPDNKKLLEYVDVLVDGLYKESLRDVSLAFRGSSNQIIWEKSGHEWIKSNLNKK